MNTLPVEILDHIVMFLDPSALSALACVCSLFLALCNRRATNMTRYLTLEKPLPPPLLLRYSRRNGYHFGCPAECYSNLGRSTLAEYRKTCEECKRMESIMCDDHCVAFHNPSGDTIGYCKLRREWYVKSCAHCKDPHGVYRATWSVRMAPIVNAHNMVWIFIRHGYGDACLFHLPAQDLCYGLEQARPYIEGAIHRNKERDRGIILRSEIIRCLYNQYKYAFLDALARYVTYLSSRESSQTRWPMLTPQNDVARDYVMEFSDALKIYDEEPNNKSARRERDQFIHNWSIISSPNPTLSINHFIEAAVTGAGVDFEDGSKLPIDQWRFSDIPLEW